MDINKITKVLNDYSKAIDAPIRLIDNDGTILYASKNIYCPVLPEQCPACKNVFRYGCNEARRFGGRYIFFCPMGFTHWASPILKDGLVETSVIGGPVLMVDLDEYIYIDMASRISLTPQKIDELTKLLSRVKMTEPSRVTSFSETLYYITAFLSEGDNQYYMEMGENYKNQLDISEYIHYIKSISSGYSELNYPFEKEKELLDYIEEGNEASARKLLNEILGYILFKSGNDLEIIKVRVLELVIVLSRAAIGGGGDAELILGWNRQYIKDINHMISIEELTDWLNKVMKRFSDTVFGYMDVKHTDSMYKAVSYIKTKYMEKITLEDVAQHVNFSPSYFSKIFKAETGKNFNTYISHVRIEKSKKMLLRDNISLIDIANMVGFEDQSYYSKVFKKIVGTSPGKYREMRGRIHQTDDTIGLFSN